MSIYVRNYSLWRAAVLTAALLQLVPTVALAQAGFQVIPILSRSAIPDSLIASVMKSKPVRATDGAERIQAAVSLQPRDIPGLEAFAEAVSDPSSPAYQLFISPKEVGERFGASKEDREKVAKYLTGQGLTIKLIADNGLSIIVEGTAASYETAFGTQLRYYYTLDEDGKPFIYRANATELTVPVALSGLITNVSGLETYTRPKPFITTLTPGRARTAYSLAPSYNSGFYGTGRNVAISNWDGFRLNNLTLFINQFGLPYPAGGRTSNVSVVPVGTGSMSNTPGGEGDLDIQMVAGQAPLANIRVYDGTGGNLIAVLTQEANDNWADVITESYGWDINESTATSAHNIHLSMTAQGITYITASGDTGTTLTPFAYPAYDPEVLVVGGTVMDVDSTTGVRLSEVGWSGSGGGWYNNNNTFNVLPSWQRGTGVPTTVNRRLIPDIALHSSGAQGFTTGAYFIYYNNAPASFLGTSCASPIFAGALTTLSQRLYRFAARPRDGYRPRLGRIQNLLYSFNGRSDIFYDITTGSNGNLPSTTSGTTNSYTGPASNCATGWDYVTGWGSINMERLYSNLPGAR